MTGSTDTVRALDVELRFWSGLARAPSSTDEAIYIHKDAAVVARIDAILEQVQPRRMIEVGVLDGGSTIYWQSKYQLERLVGFELSPAAPLLTRYLKRNGLSDTVRVHFGVSQDDAPRLHDAIAKDLEDEPVDAIIDDASHQYTETKATVEILLPFLRPGGVFIIEDWAWGHHRLWPADLWSDRPLMSPLLSELMLICGNASEIIDRIQIDPNFVVLWRGSADLPKDRTFKLSDHYEGRGFSIML